ncbi:GAF domain-containing protein [Streptomyces mirabilis]|uniref:GAF domain-containing protein n=1 Tax=Streptomyces mirabilis TaxID=68239 RepID=UPI003647070E
MPSGDSSRRIDAAAQLALVLGSDPAVLRRDAARAHERFLATGMLSGPPLRNLVRESWRRSRNRGIDPETAGPGAAALAAPELRDYRLGHPLAPPCCRSSVGCWSSRPRTTTSWWPSATNAPGCSGSRAPALVARAERIGFAEGADWSEGAAGTNAPGTALALGRPLQIYASEHFSRPVQAWSCSAAPVHDPDTGAVHDPDTGAVLGVLDLTGGDHIAAPHALALVRATVAAAEAELRLLRLQRILPVPGLPPEPASRLEVLGTDRARLSSPYGRLELSPRHSEIPRRRCRAAAALGAAYLVLPHGGAAEASGRGTGRCPEGACPCERGGSAPPRLIAGSRTHHGNADAIGRPFCPTAPPGAGRAPTPEPGGPPRRPRLE